MSRPISKLALADCLVKQFNHPFRLFYVLPRWISSYGVYQFCHLVYPFATAYFHKLSSLLRVHPSLLLVYEGLLHLTGAPLDDFSSMLFVRSRFPANVFTYSAYSTSTGSPVPPASSGLRPPSPKEKENGMRHFVPVCKSRRLYPVG